jgi:hypothetical protein
MGQKKGNISLSPTQEAFAPSALLRQRREKWRAEDAKEVIEI